MRSRQFYDRQVGGVMWLWWNLEADVQSTTVEWLTKVTWSVTRTVDLGSTHPRLAPRLLGT